MNNFTRIPKKKILLKYSYSFSQYLCINALLSNITQKTIKVVIYLGKIGKNVMLQYWKSKISLKIKKLLK